MRTRELVLLLALGLVGPACYRYTPIDLADVTPEMEIRTELTPAEREQLADVLPGDSRTLDGRVIDNGQNDILLQVGAVTSQRGVRLETLSQRVRIDRAGILQVELKERDKAKTYGLAALVTAGVATVVILAIEAGRAGETGDLGPGVPQDAVVPLLRIPIGR